MNPANKLIHHATLVLTKDNLLDALRFSYVTVVIQHVLDPLLVYGPIHYLGVCSIKEYCACKKEEQLYSTVAVVQKKRGNRRDSIDFPILAEMLALGENRARHSEKEKTMMMDENANARCSYG